ncbi:uncharacterized protein LOC119373511 isoform X2 [Rhipicephalus sanguineus]|uniref:uncharacterized protein LOC119373511 isoform X2 n=1 Tax=Rhipicephalus sanguineus TaxID=34632 RepID=UPI0018956FC5|nr:uncharacterized protein LOC119373511 isoform X2 [Rhipicephalus sanguineus]
MAKGTILGVSLLAACVSIMECRLRFVRRTPVIFIMFFSTDQPIWTYKTTERPVHECEVEQMIKKNKTSVLLMRSYNKNNSKISGYLQRTLQPRNVYQMLIQHSEYNQTEDILYMSKKLRCAVVKVTSTLKGQHTTFDLRVRNSSVTKGSTRGCKIKFWRVASGAQNVYTVKCQDILRNKTKPAITVVGNAKKKMQPLR